MEWQSLFTPTVPLLESFIRGTITYLALFFLMRVIGQRESGGLSLTDVLLVVLVVEAAGVGLKGEGVSITDSLVTVIAIFFWSVLMDALAFQFPALARVLKSRPRPLIEDGEMNRRAMRRELMSEEEVISQLRLHGIEDIEVVERAYIEPNGMISVLRRDGTEPDQVERPEM